MSDPQRTTGTAGASARREHDRRKAKRGAAVRRRHPRIGGIILALRDAPRQETAWASGGAGEQHVERALTQRCPEVVVLHDRRIPGSRANIDRIAITASGVWVIDAKRYKGKVQVTRPLFGEPALTIGGRDQTKLVSGLAKQVALVTNVVRRVGADVCVGGCLCFVDGELPMFGTPTIGGFSIVGSKGLAKKLKAAGPISVGTVAILSDALAEHFTAA
jgi:hypothetical protein